jgi:hypothetical protein
MSLPLATVAVAVLLGTATLAFLIKHPVLRRMAAATVLLVSMTPEGAALTCLIIRRPVRLQMVAATALRESTIRAVAALIRPLIVHPAAVVTALLVSMIREAASWVRSHADSDFLFIASGAAVSCAGVWPGRFSFGDRFIGTHAPLTGRRIRQKVVNFIQTLLWHEP